MTAQQAFAEWAFPYLVAGGILCAAFCIVALLVAVTAVGRLQRK